jgi:multidrug efflux pump subunit AcrA (membrane-fusion protein)
MSAHPFECRRRVCISPPAGLVTSMISQGEQRRGPRRILPILLLCAIAATAGAAYWYGFAAPKAATTARPAARAVPVTVALAARQDVPVYATGLGTVQAFVTVAIHSQVDGKLQEVLFTEGQRVKKNDVLAKIDPRLFQAALDQAKATSSDPRRWRRKITARSSRSI